jgi:hypothetical protein
MSKAAPTGPKRSTPNRIFYAGRDAPAICHIRFEWWISTELRLTH